MSLIEVKPGRKFSLGLLKDMLVVAGDTATSVEQILFFAKVYELDYRQLSELMRQLIHTPLATALFTGDHSTTLQSYIDDGIMPYIPDYEEGEITYDPEVPVGEILPEVWASLEVDVVSAIKQVGDKLAAVVDRLPGKQGEMIFRSMMKMNKVRPTIGQFQAGIHHARQTRNLVILDDSGSVNSYTIKAIIEDVVALSYKANADFALISDSCRYWEAGSFGVSDLLSAAEYSGTEYHMLKPLIMQDWDTVITIADYDSHAKAKTVLGGCTGNIEQVLDISLVNRSTYLAECVGQRAKRVQPLLIGSSPYILS